MARAWSLHIQCRWRIERGDEVFATDDDLVASDEEIGRVTDEISALMLGPVPVTVNDVQVSESDGITHALPKGLRIVITSNGITDLEDW
ncbi:hypothetical protein WM40_24440 [Robbsia andropogonis]|uniref:Uncharacterized protein n=1 Tax=Robbsia andropogonis TaxID=28092 RepID=A0A0F5JVA9_9BURK|nr:hypothetical protein WM40_24440 [Robbsia andropogonis]